MIDRATPADLPAIAAAARRMHLDDERLDASQFLVWREGDTIRAFGRIKPYAHAFELGCVGVLESFRGQGLGERMVRALIRRFPVPDVYVTTDLVDYFAGLGFAPCASPPAEIAAKLATVEGRTGRRGVIAMRLARPALPRAVVFDMDGVLLDSEPLHHAAMNAVLAREGHAVDLDGYRRYIGTTDEDTWGDLVTRFHLAEPRDVYRERYDALILESYRRESTPAPGVHALLAALNARGLRLAVASSSRRVWVEAALERLGVDGWFECVVTGDMVRRGKPDPAIYALAAERLDVAPRECLAIEDAPNGIASARAAGLTVVGVRTPYTSHLAIEGAAVMLPNLAAFDFALVDNALSPA